MGNSPPAQALLRRRAHRPTVMDQRFRGDPWLDGQDGVLHLYLGNFRLAVLPGLDLDLPHLNQLLDRLRQGPRGRA
jgi:hypothetical protein